MTASLAQRIDDQDRHRSAAGFLDAAALSTDVRRIYDRDVDEHGYVMNASRLWAHQPALHDALFDMVGRAARAARVDMRQRAILITACASALGDAYCSLAWGKRLAAAASVEVASGVLRGDDRPLSARERVLARWARRIASAPNDTDAGDVDELREAGFDDDEIFAITVFVAFRIAFSIVNDALGARPDRALADAVPAPVRDAVTFGRPVGVEAP